MAIAPGTTILDHIVPARKSVIQNIFKDGILVVSSSILMALAAHAQIILPFTPVPITLQTFVLLLVAATLGSKRGALAMILYLVEGASGLPVFATGGGPLYLFVVPSAGYLWSYPVAAFVVGWFSERGFDRSLKTSFIAMLLGTVIIYLFGVTWLAWILHVSIYQAMVLGFFPFIAGDLIKIALATILLPGAWFFVWLIKR